MIKYAQTKHSDDHIIPGYLSLSLKKVETEFKAPDGNVIMVTVFDICAKISKRR